MDTPKTIPFPVQTETIVDRYDKLKKENPTPEQLQEFIANESDPITELMAEALVFIVTFMQDYGENETVKQHMGSVWPKWPEEPSLIQIGYDMLATISDGFPYEQDYNLNEKQTSQFNAILKYLQGFMSQTHFITAVCFDEDGDIRDEQFCFDPDEMTAEDRNSANEAFEYWLKACFVNGGALILRIYRQDKGENDMLFGFSFKEGTAKITTPAELKNYLETTPDGETVPAPNVSYQRPFINLN